MFPRTEPSESFQRPFSRGIQSSVDDSAPRRESKTPTADQDFVVAVSPSRFLLQAGFGAGNGQTDYSGPKPGGSYPTNQLEAERNLKR
jgi:hypothetical protein